jgi:hypothetical protein
MAIRYKRSTPATWKSEMVRQHDLYKKIKKYDHRIMYPSAHDIHPNHLEENMIFLNNILTAGNEVLIVSKPHLEVIKEICSRFVSYKNKILFRFSIGSADDNVLKFWEPNAPDFNERLDSLKWAFKEGFQTSISCEPMLDNHIEDVIDKVEPYVTETIWIGKINRLLGKTGRGRLDFNGHNDPNTLLKAHELIDWQSDDNIIALYEKYKNDPQIMWKESIKRIINI